VPFSLIRQPLLNGFVVDKLCTRLVNASVFRNLCLSVCLHEPVSARREVKVREESAAFGTVHLFLFVKIVEASRKQDR
jgi:hypothetical protein